MRGLAISFAAAAPITFLLTDLFSTSDWQLWAILGAAFWLRIIGPLAGE